MYTNLLRVLTITVPNTAAEAAAVNNTNRKVIYKNFAPFTNWITEINNTQVAQVDEAQDFDIVMTMYNLTENSDAYLKTTGSSWQYYKDKPALDNNNNIINFLANNNNKISFKFQQ